jgi:hypothetical protein
MTATDDLEVIRELLTGKPPSQDANDYVKGRLTAVIAAEAQPPVRHRPRSRRTVAGLTAAVAALAAVVIVAVMVPGASHPVVRASRPGAAQLLAKIATAAGRQPVPAIRDSQFEYIESRETDYVLSQPTGSGSNQTSWRSIHRTGPYERQIWISVSDLCHPGLLRQEGTTMHVALPSAPPSPSGTSIATPVATHCPDRGDLGSPTYRLLQSLPTSPAALLHRVDEFDVTVGGYPLRGARADAGAFATISALVGESIVPPALSAALYRAVALIPGVRILPTAVDALGRSGVGVVLQAGASWGPSEMIFDRQTLQLMGTFTNQPPSADHGTLPNGRTLPAISVAFQVRAFVNHIGQLPRS